MRLAVIAPPNMLDRYCVHTHYQMALARKVLADPAYARFYKDRNACGDWVIMDNGAAEEGTLNPEQLAKAAYLCHANEIVAPDVINDRYATMELYDNWYHKLPNGYHKMVVPQGSDVAEWMECASYMLGTADVQTIGVSKYHRTDRRVLLRTIERAGWHTRGVEFHLLGVAQAPRDVIAIAREFPWIRGIDTAAPVAYGLVGQMPDGYEHSGHIGLNWDSAAPPVGSLLDTLILRNIEVMKEWCGD